MSTERFTLEADHLTLLRHANVCWDDSEYGAPGIDSKRPYGNSYVLGDISKILSGTYEVDPLQEERYSKLHQELHTVLQIIFTSGEMTPGTYARDVASTSDWRPNWRRVQE